MTITHKLKMNLEERDITLRLEMPLGDVSSRQIQLLLYSRQTIWPIPEDVTVLIKYEKPDGTKGEYDTLPDGSAAWSAEGNVLTLAVAPQALTMAGQVTLYAELYLEEKVLHTFAVEIWVKAPTAGRRSGNSEDYFYMTNVLRGPLMAQNGQLLAAGKVDAYGRVTEVAAVDAASVVDENGSAILHKAQTLTDSQKNQARANIGAASQTSVDFLLEKLSGSGVVLSDEKTGEKYVLYVENGKLKMNKE